MLWISRLGVQTDEALFSAGIYAPFPDPTARIRVFGHDYTIMVMTYVGSLKARIWSPIFRVFGVSAGSVRIPAVLIGTASVWWFYGLLRRTIGHKAAVIGAGILATDPLYMLTIRWDWGPVALQHALLIGGLLAIVRWWQESTLLWLAVGFFAFGLGMWDKALFIWSLAALTVAAVVILPRELIRAVRPIPVLVASAAFLLGAAPLILYNVRNDWITFRSNVEPANQEMLTKLPLVPETIDGSSMLGTLTRSEWEGPLREPGKWHERLLVMLANLTGGQRHSLQLVLIVLGVAALPLFWHTSERRVLLFSIVFAAVTWVQMASVKNGGTSAHHVILLWPAPAAVLAASAGALADRTARPWRFALLLVAITMTSGMLVTTTYYRDMLRNGGSLSWTDAFYPAISYVRSRSPQRLCLIEWGFFDNSRLFTRGRITLSAANDPGLNDDQRSFAEEQIRSPETLYITHTKGNESEPGKTERFLRYAAELGYQRTDVRAFADSNGRPMIEVFRLAPNP